VGSGGQLLVDVPWFGLSDLGGGDEGRGDGGGGGFFSFMVNGLISPLSCNTQIMQSKLRHYQYCANL
jgi:hypothetical protein